MADIEDFAAAVGTLVKTKEAAAYGGAITTGGDLNAALGRPNRSTLYEILDYGVGVANMPPNPYQGFLEVMVGAGGRRLMQRVTYDESSTGAKGPYLRRAVMSGGAWVFSPWLDTVNENYLASINARLDSIGPSPIPEQNPRVLSDMTGWVAGPTAAATYDMAVPDPVLGATSVSITGQGHVDRTGIAPFSMLGRGLVFWLKVENIESVSGAYIKASSTNGFTAAFAAPLPIAPGGKSPLKDGEWFPVYLSPGSLYVNNGAPNISSLVAIRVHLEAAAGKPAPKLTIGGVSNYQDKAPRYPAGAVSITFDDSWKAHASIAAPRLARHGLPATAYLVNSRIGTAGNMSFGDLHRLREVYGWEIGAHASNDAAHTDWREQSPEWVAAELAAQRAWQEEHGFLTDSFAYPIGPFTAEHARAASVYYQSARSTYPWVNSAKEPHRYRLSCSVMNAASTVAGLQTTLNRAKANGGWLVLMFHNIVESGATGNDVNRSTFEQIIDAVAASGLPVATVGDVIRAARG